MGLREGKNREIKKVLEHLGLAVNRLIRVSFGPFELGDLAEGEVAEVRTRVLRDQLGAKLAREAGVDFDAPIVERAAPAREPRPEPREERRGGATARPRARSALGAAATRTRADGSSGTATAAGHRAPLEPERRRKHVSALRAEIAADEAGPRKRIERSATHDRKGRTIAVERISPAGREAPKPAAEVTRAAGGPGPGKRRRQRFEAKRETVERPRRPDPYEVKRARDGEGRERPPRAEYKGRGPRAEFKRQGQRKETAQGRPEGGGRDRPDAREKRRGAAPPRADRAGPAPAGRRAPRDAAQRERKSDRPQGERRGKADGAGALPAPSADARQGTVEGARRRVAPAAAKALSMRIVGGRLKGRVLAASGFPRHPTELGALRKSIFDILEHRYPASLEGARVVDLFAGSGALGDRGAVARGAVRPLRRQWRRGARPPALQCRGPGARRRDPDLAGGRDPVGSARRPAARSGSPSSTRPTAGPRQGPRSPRSSKAAGSSRTRSASSRRL